MTLINGACDPGKEVTLKVKNSSDTLMDKIFYYCYLLLWLRHRPCDT